MLRDRLVDFFLVGVLLLTAEPLLPFQLFKQQVRIDIACLAKQLPRKLKHGMTPLSACRHCILVVLPIGWLGQNPFMSRKIF